MRNRAILAATLATVAVAGSALLSAAAAESPLSRSPLSRGRPAAAAPSTVAPQPPVPVQLRADVEVDSDSVMLADIFDGAEQVGAVAVARAPEPGRKLMLEAQFLAAIAARYRLAWTPASRYERVVITRASAVVETDQLLEAVRAALLKEGYGKDAEITLDSRQTVHLPAGGAVDLRVDRLTVDRGSGRFRGEGFAQAQGGSPTTFYLSGRVMEMVQVPVLAERMGEDGIIRTVDLRWIPMRADRLPPNVITDADSLIGKSPKRSLSAGAPIRDLEIRPAVVVPKNGVVAMVYQHGRLMLTSQGRAIEEGGMGDTIRVINTSTNRTVYAKVEGPNRVSVFAGSRLATATANRN